jgi:predicted ATPase/DNA-binding winged helix-turn-helix (wHTH) protein
MQQGRQILFKPFCLDLDNACLWRGARRISLTPKAFMVLQHLVMQHGQLITRDALLEAVWPDTIVGDAVLKVCVREIRRALGDTAKTPQFIATVYRQGYRFIRRVATVDRLPESNVVGRPLHAVSPGAFRRPQAPCASSAKLVGREESFAYLHGRLAQARQGKRQLVFVTGEAGIGKTALVEAFAAQVATDQNMWTVRVECIEQYGTGEAYLPVLEALGRLCRVPEGRRLIALLQHQAPTWLMRMPWLLGEKDRNALQNRVLNATREGMLLEIAEVIEALTAEIPLVLVVEDLHWSDYATLDLISFLARRHEAARLLIIGTYRPVEVIINEHPLKGVKQALEMQERCVELPLELLSESEVAAYLEARFQESQFPASLTQLLYQCTDGNPLFLVTMVEYMLAQRILGLHNGRWILQAEIKAVEIDIPESLRQMIEQQFERLTSEEQRILEAASVLGVEFSAPAVAAALEKELVEIEACCDVLSRKKNVLKAVGSVEWPDGTVAAYYAFLHWLYQYVSYQRIGMTQRVRLHQRIGKRLELAYGHHVGQIAAELAVHFARGRETHRAILYLQYAADTASRRFAYRESISYLTQALELVEGLPAAEQVNFRVTNLKNRSLVRHAMGDRVGEEEDLAVLAQYEVYNTSFQQQSLFA